MGTYKHIHPIPLPEIQVAAEIFSPKKGSEIVLQTDIQIIHTESYSSIREAQLQPKAKKDNCVIQAKIFSK